MSVPKLLFKDIQLWKMLLLLLGPVSSLWWEKLQEREQFAGKGIRACRDALQIITLFPLLRSRFKVSDQKKVDCSHNYSEGRRMAASPWTVRTNSTDPLAPPRARTQTSNVCLIFGAICGVTKWRTQRKSAQLRLCKVIFFLYTLPLPICFTHFWGHAPGLTSCICVEWCSSLSMCCWSFRFLCSSSSSLTWRALICSCNTKTSGVKNSCNENLKHSIISSALKKQKPEFKISRRQRYQRPVWSQKITSKDYTYDFSHFRITFVVRQSG